MNDSQVMLAMFAMFSAIVGGFFKQFATQNKTHEKIADGMQKLAKASDAQTREMAKGNRQSAERNGHLGDQNIQIIKLVKDTHKDMVSTMENIQEQHVEKQVVAEQEVDTEIVNTKINKRR
jgi:hypothetical protein